MSQKSMKKQEAEPEINEEDDIAEQVIASTKEPAPAAADVGGTISPIIEEDKQDETPQIGVETEEVCQKEPSKNEEVAEVGAEPEKVEAAAEQQAAAVDEEMKCEEDDDAGDKD